MKVWRVVFTDGTKKDYRARSREDAASKARAELHGKREIRSIYVPIA